MQTAPREIKTFTAYVEWDPDTELYMGIIPGVPGAHTQAATLDELRSNMKEVLQLCLWDERAEPFHIEANLQVELEVRAAP